MQPTYRIRREEWLQAGCGRYLGVRVSSLLKGAARSFGRVNPRKRGGCKLLLPPADQTAVLQQCGRKHESHRPQHWHLETRARYCGALRRACAAAPSHSLLRNG